MPLSRHNFLKSKLNDGDIRETQSHSSLLNHEFAALFIAADLNGWKHSFTLSVFIEVNCKFGHKLLSTNPTAVFLNSGPHDPLPCMFSMFPSSTTPDSNDQLVIKLCSGLIRSHSFESGVVEEGIKVL